jgi:hypothetical protein
LDKTNAIGISLQKRHIAINSSIVGYLEAVQNALRGQS